MDKETSEALVFFFTTLSVVLSIAVFMVGLSSTYRHGVIDTMCYAHYQPICTEWDWRTFPKPE